MYVRITYDITSCSDVDVRHALRGDEYKNKLHPKKYANFVVVERKKKMN